MPADQFNAWLLATDSRSFMFEVSHPCTVPVAPVILMLMQNTSMTAYDPSKFATLNRTYNRVGDWLYGLNTTGAYSFIFFNSGGQAQSGTANTGASTSLNYAFAAYDASEPSQLPPTSLAYHTPLQSAHNRVHIMFSVQSNLFKRDLLNRELSGLQPAFREKGIKTLLMTLLLTE
jgi:hypothetical protein